MGMRTRLGAWARGKRMVLPIPRGRSADNTDNNINPPNPLAPLGEREALVGAAFGASSSSTSGTDPDADSLTESEPRRSLFPAFFARPAAPSRSPDSHAAEEAQNNMQTGVAQAPSQAPSQAQPQPQPPAEDPQVQGVLMVYQAVASAAPRTRGALRTVFAGTQGAESVPVSKGIKFPFSTPSTRHFTSRSTPPGTQAGIQTGLLRRVLEETEVSVEALEAGACECLRHFPWYATAQPHALVASLWAMEALQALHSEGAPGASAASPGHTEEGTGEEGPSKGGAVWGAPGWAGRLGRTCGVPGGDASSLRCRYEDMCQRQLEIGTELRFESLLGGACGSVRERVGSGELEVYLRDAKAVSLDLFPVRDAIASAFPAAFQSVLQLYTRNFVEASRLLSEAAPVLSNEKIGEAVAWAEKLQSTFIKAGAGEALAQVPLEAGALDPLMETYTTRVKEYLGQCFRNQVRLFVEAWAEGSAASGKGASGCTREEDLWELGDLAGEKEGALKMAGVQLAVEAYRMVHSELDAAKATQCPAFTRRVADALCSSLQGLQEHLLAAVKGTLRPQGTPVPVLPRACPPTPQGIVRLGPRGLVALANASVQCMEEARELEDDVTEWLEANGSEEKEAEEGYPGGFTLISFDEVAREASRLLIRRAFESCVVKDPLAQLYSARWHESSMPTQALLSTLQGLLWSWEPRMLGCTLQLTAGACLERVALVYVERLVHRQQTLCEATVERLFGDVRMIRDVFTRFLGDQGAWDRVRVLVELGNLANASSVRSFVTGYSDMLASTWPECSPRLVQRLAALLPDVNKRARQQIVEQCGEVWKSPRVLVQGPLDRDPSFVRVGSGCTSCC